MLGQEFLALEPREAPAAHDLGAGHIYLAPYVVRHAFEDVWAGPLNIYETEERIYVGAGDGGGPRVQVYNHRGDLLDDFFAGDPTSRAGVYFVPTDPPSAPVLPPVDPGGDLDHPDPPVVYVEVPVEVSRPVEEITLGDVDHPDPFVVYVDWEHPPSPEYVRAGMNRLVANLPLPGLVFTTVRPNLWPGLYGTLVMGADLSYATEAAGAEPGGLAFGRWSDAVVRYGESEAVYASYKFTTQEIVGDLMAHEIAHGFGWEHGSDGDFRNDLEFIAQGVELARMAR